MGNVHRLLTALAINRQFIRDFIDADAPCFALGMLEERKQVCGFLALRPNVAIPQAVMDRGFRFGHSLMGNADFEVVHFAFEFYGFGNYNVLVNPNSPLVRTVLNAMVDSGTYFFLVIGPDQSVSTFRSEPGAQDLVGLGDNIQRINQSSTTDAQYRKAVAQYKLHPDPPGQLLTWVCRHSWKGLDTTRDRLEMRPRSAARRAPPDAVDEPAPDDATPNWQPLSMLPLIAAIIDGQVETANEQYGNLLRARDRPHVLDDDTVQRVVTLFTDELEFLPIHREQLARWSSAHPTPVQRREIERLSSQLDRIEPVLRDVLSLARELASGTIDTILRMPDGELGLAMCEGRMKPPSGPSPTANLRVAEQRAMAELLDARIEELEKAGAASITLLALMEPQMPMFHRLMESADERFLSDLSQTHGALYRYAKMLEMIAEGIRSGDIKVPP